jgi:hypothetical protein
VPLTPPHKMQFRGPRISKEVAFLPEPLTWRLGAQSSAIFPKMWELPLPMPGPSPAYSPGEGTLLPSLQRPCLHHGRVKSWSPAKGHKGHSVPWGLQVCALLTRQGRQRPKS